MPKKHNMKAIFESNFNAQKMRTQILKELERKNNNYMNKILKYALPMCVIAMICGVLIINNNPLFLKEAEKTTQDIKNIIEINQLKSISEKRIDAITRDINEKSDWLDKLKDEIIVPKDLDKSSYYGIYTKDNKTKKYTILNCYVYEYYNELYRSVRISFSKNTKPMRDYGFSELNSVSKINNIELKIYQYEKTYFTEFKYNGYNFDIEVNNLNLEELVKILESIIK